MSFRGPRTHKAPKPAGFSTCFSMIGASAKGRALRVGLLAIFLAGPLDWPQCPALAASTTEGLWKIRKVAHCGGFLEGPTLGTDGLLRVLDLLRGKVLEVRDGQCIPVALTGGLANGAKNGLDGAMYIADARRGVLRLAPGAKDATIEIGEVDGKALTGANDLAFDASGGLYITVPAESSHSHPTGTVYYQARRGAPARVFYANLSYPNGIALSPDGKMVFVGQFTEKSIIALPSATNRDEIKSDYVFAHTSGGIGPDGMIVDRAGRLIWANFGNGTLTIADAFGNIIGTIVLPSRAGRRVTNVVEGANGYFITEAEKGEIWEVLRRPGRRSATSFQKTRTRPDHPVRHRISRN